MSFRARGFVRLHAATKEDAWRRKAKFALQWLIENRSPVIRGHAGAITSTINRGRGICRRAFRRLSGPL